MIGIITFLLMVRSSMFVGWWQLLRNPRQVFRRPSVDAETTVAHSGGVDEDQERFDVVRLGSRSDHGSGDEVAGTEDGTTRGQGGSEKSEHSSDEDGLKEKEWSDGDDEGDDEEEGVGGPSRRWTGGADGIGVALGHEHEVGVKEGR